MEANTIHAVKALRERNAAERQLSALVTAVRVHERAQWKKPYPRRADDLNLYRRVRQIIGETE
ncbi:MAG TPA: hypothetical protein VHH72_01185 [Solirubrobacterales bacterium]|jgi:hypothetical protein|nr:hypothetical protein [Solirubrobacterales bacterium]